MKEAVKTWSTPVEEEKRRLIPCALCGGRRFRPRFSCEGFSYVRCVRCGLVQMNPQPEPEQVAGRYRESHGEDYLSYELANEGNFLRLQELALEDAGFGEIEAELLGSGSRRPRLIDIGCATGALLEKLRNRGWESAGLEISPSAEYARRERGLDVRGLPLEDCRFPAGSFNVVLASHLIEHLNDPAGFAAEVYRVLAPGGRFLVTTPNISGFQARLFGSRWRSAIFDHLYLFSVKTLSRLLLEKGFTLERILTWGGLAAGTAPAPIKGLADKAAKRLGFGDVTLIRARR
ncbi:MAG: class I SAM-dependent methyltransferase [Treponema sp.]|nr:class I SAM-dependent methyltransferase [Treponema sp.]